MLKPKQIRFKYLIQESFLLFIKNSVGTRMFQSFLVKKNGKISDILNKGDLSCAFYASSLLLVFHLVKRPHFTVYATVEDLLKTGGKKIPLSKLRPGDVLVWGPKKGKNGLHNHIGFFIGKNQAVSNNDKTRIISKHHYQFNNKRLIEMAIRPDWKRPNA